MDAGLAALLGAGVGATAGLVGPIVTAWMARKAEREAWERNQRADLYTEMLKWSHQLEQWLAEELQLPFPGPPSATLAARSQFIAHPQVRLAWSKLSLSYDLLRYTDLDVRGPQEVPGATAKAVRQSLNALVDAVHADRLLRRTP